MKWLEYRKCTKNKWKVAKDKWRLWLYRQGRLPIRLMLLSIWPGRLRKKMLSFNLKLYAQNQFLQSSIAQSHIAKALEVVRLAPMPARTFDLELRLVLVCQSLMGRLL